ASPWFRESPDSTEGWAEPSLLITVTDSGRATSQEFTTLTTCSSPKSSAPASFPKALRSGTTLANGATAKDLVAFTLEKEESGWNACLRINARSAGTTSPASRPH
ncbi:unnamed protein product, partial [Tilletia laevis]